MIERVAEAMRGTTLEISANLYWNLWGAVSAGLSSASSKPKDFDADAFAKQLIEKAAQAAIAALWTPFNAEDESTWPTEADGRPGEPELLISMRMSDGTVCCDLAFWEDGLWWADNGHSHYHPKNIDAWMSIVTPPQRNEI